jgi:hypothetical protein
MKLPLSQAPGKKTYMQTDGDDIHVVTEQQVDPIIAANKRMANDWRYGSLIGNTQRHQQKVAEIPGNLYHQLVEKLGEPKHNLTAWKKWLNDPENRHFRSIGGTV